MIIVYTGIYFSLFTICIFRLSVSVSRGGCTIFSRGWRNLPGGGENIARYPPYPERFLLSYTTLLIYAHCFDILDTYYEEIYNVYFLKKFLVRLLFCYTQVWFPATSDVQEGRKPYEMVRGWRGGLRHPPGIASALQLPHQLQSPKVLFYVFWYS